MTFGFTRVLANAVAAEYRKPVVLWLCACAFLVFCMVWVGGLTRLTESGLSIVEWKPVTGAIPPITDADWQAELAKYQTSPQYKKVNHGMNVEQFKQIFWLEYIHRLIARAIGFAFLLPFAYFASRKAFNLNFGLKLLGMFALGGAQGLVGWLMVKSGLENDPWVNPVRLAMHLGLAFLIFSWMFWTMLGVRELYRPALQHKYSPGMYNGAVTLCVMVFIQVLLGALVAGNDAGMTYNTFPLMDGRFVPDGLWLDTPAYTNFFHNVAMVQFNHRIMAYLLTVAVVMFCWHGVRKYPQYTTLFYVIFSALVVQFLLGVFTLMLVVPVSLAVLHQANAMILFAVCIKAAFVLRPRTEDSVQGLPKANPSLAMGS